MKSRILILAVLAAIACDKGDDPASNDPNFYATRFYDEAAKRGVSLPSQQSIPITFVEDEEIAPYAGYATYDPPTVRFAETTWGKMTPMQKELLVFHEFGHAALKRVHCDERLPNCEYKSMMFGGMDWVFNEDIDDERKEWYFDELFNPSVPYPSWGGTAPTIHVDLGLGVIEERGQWEFHGESGTTHTSVVDETIKVAGEHSLGIHAAEPGNPASVSYWFLPQLLNNDVPVGATLTVSVKVKTNSLTGKGVWIWVQADVADESGYSVTSDTYRLVQGTNDWTEISQKIHCYPSTRPHMRVFLGIDGIGTGDVWFDEIKVGYDH